MNNQEISQLSREVRPTFVSSNSDLVDDLLNSPSYIIVDAAKFIELTNKNPASTLDSDFILPKRFGTRNFGKFRIKLAS
jgi:hypothetical protein